MLTLQMNVTINNYHLSFIVNGWKHRVEGGKPPWPILISKNICYPTLF